MCGYLFDENKFNSVFQYPIESSFNKINVHLQKEGNNKLIQLHKKCLPFILRRLKSNVLNELPRKIIQDIYCDLNFIQLELYNKLIQNPKVRNLVNNNNTIGNKLNNELLSALDYILLLFLHPKLILVKEHPLYSTVKSRLQ